MAIVTPRTLKILQQNVQHWQNKRHALTNAYYKEDPDIILINSHCLTNGNTVKIYNYKCHTTNKNNENHSGAAICIRNNIHYKILDNFESDLIGAEIETQQGPIRILTTYVPPRTSYLHYPDLYKALNSKTPAYIFADLNARHSSLGHNSSNTRGEQLATLINRGHAIHLGPNFATYINHRSATNPDIVIGNKSIFHNIALQQGTIATPSDHQYIIGKISANPIQIPTRPRPSFPKADWNKYREAMNNQNSTNLQIITPQAIEQAVNNFMETIKESSKIAIPKTTYRTIPHAKTNEQIRILQIQYNTVIEDIQNNGPTRNKYQLLVHIRTELQEEYRTMNNEMWNDITQKLSHEKDPKKFWTSIKKLQGNTNKAKATYIRDHQDNKIHTEQGREEIFRRYWQNIFRITDEENEDFDEEHEEEIKQALEQNKEKLQTHTIKRKPNINEIQVTNEELIQAIAKQKHKTPGLSGITKAHLQQLPQNMLHNYREILTACLTIGYFPTQWKIATMIFLPKPNKSPYSHINYRPISLLEVPGKIFETIINRRLIQFLDNNNLHNPRQHGFRQQRGTDTALALLTEQVSYHKAQKHRVELILRDVGKAFDKVWHEGLSYKLLTIGTPGYLLRTIHNYLNNRKAKIRIGQYIGPEFQLHSGVPQGGCLSPTLFNIYTQDLPKPFPRTEIIQYADDITQICTNPGKSLAMHHANTIRAIDTINRYEHKWKIRTNKDKFQIISAGTCRHKQLHTQDATIEYSTTAKVLGLKITNTGYSAHVKERIHIANSTLTRMYRFRNIKQKTKKKLYTTLIRPQLIYPVIPLHSISTTQQKNMQRVQNRATRFITNINRQDAIPSSSIHDSIKLEPVNTVIHKQAQKIWQKIEHNFPQETWQKFSHQYNTNRYFPSSYKKAKQNIITAIYA